MKANKKAIFGMLVAMVMSLGIIGGINNSNQKDFDLQQATVVLTYASAAGQIGNEVYSSQTQGAMAVAALGTAIATKTLASCAIAFGWCPIGWVAGTAAAAAGL